MHLGSYVMCYTAFQAEFQPGFDLVTCIWQVPNVGQPIFDQAAVLAMCSMRPNTKTLNAAFLPYLDK